MKRRIAILLPAETQRGLRGLSLLLLIMAFTAAACITPAPLQTEEEHLAAEQARREATLAILSFTGAQGKDGETLAELFSF